MSTYSTKMLIDASVDGLMADLQILEPQMLLNKEGMYITHDSVSTISVYAASHYRAYIPKKYDGWDVEFIQWNGDEFRVDDNLLLGTN